MNKDLKRFVGSIREYGLEKIHAKSITGFEKESLRVIDSKISSSQHPGELGSSLTNRYITTDFSESQLEMITPPMEGIDNSLNFLDSIHHFVSGNIGEEILWPLSMPPLINSENEIPIANFGKSNEGQFKSLYRHGLSERYGRLMQAISGLHFNFSLPEDIWSNGELIEKKLAYEVKSAIYFSMIRNIYSFNWILLYLFGASPSIPKNYLKKESDSFIDSNNDICFLPYATSLRMSDFGYCNIDRKKITVSVNSLSEYIDDLREATTTQDSKFSTISSSRRQLNSNILQIEDEYYAVARAKSANINFRRASSGLLKGGVDFLEVRSLDLDPFSRYGINSESSYFLELFMLYCLMNVSEKFNKDDLNHINQNDLLVCKYGRDPRLRITCNGKKISIRDWGHMILDDMQSIAESIDFKKERYTNTIESFRNKITNPELTISGHMMEELQKLNYDYIDLGRAIGSENRDYYGDIPIEENENWMTLENSASNSLIQQDKIEQKSLESKISFEDYKAEYYKS